MDVAANCTVDDDSKTVTVTAGATAEVGFAITCTPIPPSASKSSVSANPDNFGAGLGSSTITVTVKDASGNPLDGVTVMPSSTGTGNVFAPTSGPTDGNGVATFSFSSTVAEKKTITVVAGGVTLNDKPVITVFPLETTTTITDVDPEPSTAGVPFTVTFTVAGEGGTTPTGGTVTVFSQEESGTVGCVNVPVSDGSCDLTLTMSITHHLQAVYSGDSQFNGSTSAVFTHEVTSP
jgi:adhesin/invasin